MEETMTKIPEAFESLSTILRHLQRIEDKEEMWRMLHEHENVRFVLATLVGGTEEEKDLLLSSYKEYEKMRAREEALERRDALER